MSLEMLEKLARDHGIQLTRDHRQDAKTKGYAVLYSSHDQPEKFHVLHVVASSDVYGPMKQYEVYAAIQVVDLETGEIIDRGTKPTRPTLKDILP